MNKTLIQIPIELEDSKYIIRDLFVENINIKIDDTHQKNCGGPGIDLVLGFIISFIGGEALSGFLKGLGLDIKKPFETIGKNIKYVPEKLKQLYELNNKSKEKTGLILKIKVNFARFELVFPFYNINSMESFLEALIGIDVFLNYLQENTTKESKEAEYVEVTQMIILKWDDGRWKIDLFPCNFM